MTDHQNQAAAWFPYEEDIYDVRESAIDARNWLDKPAGKHGWLKMENNKFVFEDGTPVTFWGTNVTEECVHPEAGLRTALVDRLAKFGLNAVRFHKFTWPHSGVVVSDGPSTELDPEKMDRMDRFFADLKAEGIYITWSHIFGHMVSEQDALESGFVGRELFYDNGNSYGMANFAEDFQDLIIKLTVNLLNHVNPYTGLRYADDPALAMIELQNEDNFFFFGELRASKHPFYMNLLNRLFNQWLKAKYASESDWRQAWGAGALEEGESLQEGTVRFRYRDIPLRPEQEGYRPEWKQRMLDTMRFMHETQNRFYARYSEAIRATGYKGVLIGSPWFTPQPGIPHYYNLLSDALVGPIDRHEYWGGGEIGHVLKPGAVRHTSMLASPGSALLRRGTEQVAGRPFIMSEWNTTEPNEWIAEGPFLIAAYGMGLQGWAGSFSYAVDHFHNIYNANRPPHIGQYPALARMIYRGDVTEAEWMRLLRVDPETFADNPEVPDAPEKEWIAVGKTGVLFPSIPSGERHEIIKGDLSDYWDRSAKVIRSSTGQLTWDYGQRLVTLNTAGTQGFVGFVEGKERLEFTDFCVDEMKTPFCNVLLGSLEKKPIRSSRRLILSALARCLLTGMRYNEDRSELLEIGEKPYLVEPVQARITLHTADHIQSIAVNILDQQGCRTGRQVPAEKLPSGGFAFRIDGTHRTFWYEIVVS